MSYGYREFKDMRPNKITGPNAGGPPRLSIRMPLTARAGR